MVRVEIERKFLVKNDGWRGKAEGVLFRQGYVARVRERVVRVRMAGDRGVLTIKIRPETGPGRTEYEYAIPPDEAEAILNSLSPSELVEKYRYTFPENGVTWEVDEFLGANQGLILAEVELQREDQPLLLPAWLGEEVSSVSKYFNLELAHKPYAGWRA
jgi:CYTH domain-containing protein